MHKVSRGLLAAGAGSLLLLGGGGTLAYWGDADTVDGGTFDSGQLRLEVDATNAGCGDWMLDDGEGTEVYDTGDKIVPGDELKRDCAFTVKAEGEHLVANVGIGSATFVPGGATAFGGMLTPSVSSLSIDGSPVTQLTEAHDEKALLVSVTVTFNSAAGNGTQDLSTVLNDLTITTTQVHS
jgi:alternate signal-mediated exported protein